MGQFKHGLFNCRKVLFAKAIGLEYRYAEDTMPRGVLGLNAVQFKEYLRFIGNRRAQQIGLDELHPGATNPFPWMAEMIDLKKEKNFFETRVTEYQTRGVGLGLNGWHEKRRRVLRLFCSCVSTGLTLKLRFFGPTRCGLISC